MSINGRPIVPGVASHVRQIPARATLSDLWAPVDALTYDTIARLQKLHGVRLTSGDAQRFISYIVLAREYYGATKEVGPTAKPLLAYYFMLNLVKAFLTATDPLSTAAAKLLHGVSSNERTQQRYRFTQEQLVIQAQGVFRTFAERTGDKFCWPKGTTIPLVKLLPYLPEAYDLLQDSETKAKLLPITGCRILARPCSPGGEAWIRVDIDRSVLESHGLSARSVQAETSISGFRFGLVHDDADPSTVSYESVPVGYARFKRDVAQPLILLYDSCIFGHNRTLVGGRRYITLSARRRLMSHEAVTFGVMLHLSNMVRYRPHRVDALLGDRHSWLLRGWVERAAENFLLGVSSRLILEEQVIG